MFKSILLLCLSFGTIVSLSAQTTLFPVVPLNGDTIHTPYPMFNWFYANSGSNDRMTYNFVLVEMGENQSPDEAVMSNLPLIRKEAITEQQLFYPIDAPELKENVWYAWQIQKQWSNTLVERSEAWKFILSEPEEIETLEYVKLKRHNDGTPYIVKNGKIGFVYKERYVDGDLSVRVLNDKQEVVLEQVKVSHEENPLDGQVNVKEVGGNFYEMDLGSLNKAGSYQLYITSTKNRTYILPFIVK